jgi:hypothetical protein
MGRIEYKIKKLIEVRAYKFKELAALYNVSAPTLRKWFLLMNVKVTLDGGYFTIPQVETIMSDFGMPYLIYDIDYELSEDKPERKEFKKPFEMRPYKLKELSELYKVCPRTLKRWAEPFREEMGELVGGYYLIPQIELLIKHIGLPYFIYEAEENKEKDAA